ncbi:MAG: phosphomannomutase/phosphoglucomutase [Candidatus Gracilibacteria bacterium]|jgi:phosphomannomutase/phosphoglucomutase
MVNPLIFRAYDIRGFAHKPVSENPPDLTPETIRLIGKASGTYFKRHFGTNLAVGYDCRISNPELANAFIDGVLSTGCTVTVLGMVFTPLLYFSVCHFGFDGGASITASHNPKEYNGVKLVGKNAHSICGDELQEVLKLIQAEDFEVGQGELKTLDAFPAYLEKLQSIVKIERPLKVVVDSGNGATGPFVKQFFESLGCTVIPLFTEPDGNFPNHEANPEEVENMQDLIAAVKAEHADLGLGFDGDGDRVGVVDETGKHYQADLLLLQVARDLLSRKPGSKVVFDVKVSQVLIDDIKAHGGIPVMAKTGHSFIEKTMLEEGAPLGGEISGHLFFAENYYGFDDAFLGAARLLEILSRSPNSFSSLFTEVPQTASTPEFKSPCPDDKKFAIVEEIAKNLGAKYPSITIDGIRVNFDAHSWGAVRCSNTSPNLTLRFEAPTPEHLKEIIQIMLEELEKYPEIDLWWAKQFK